MKQFFVCAVLFVCATAAIAADDGAAFRVNSIFEAQTRPVIAKNQSSHGARINPNIVQHPYGGDICTDDTASFFYNSVCRSTTSLMQMYCSQGSFQMCARRMHQYEDGSWYAECGTCIF